MRHNTIMMDLECSLQILESQFSFHFFIYAYNLLAILKKNLIFFQTNISLPFNCVN